jgi:transcriptional regulator with XRE-family HTH domain
VLNLEPDRKGGNEMTYTYNKLRGRIVEMYGTQGKFAEKLGISKNSVSKKMNCQTEFSQEDIIRWSMLLNVKKDEYGEYFFS